MAKTTYPDLLGPHTYKVEGITLGELEELEGYGTTRVFEPRAQGGPLQYVDVATETYRQRDPVGMDEPVRELAAQRARRGQSQRPYTKEEVLERLAPYMAPVTTGPPEREAEF